MDRLSRALRPATDDDTPDDVLLSGPSGVGKTVVARKTLEELQGSAHIRTANLHCLGSNAGTILREAIREHPRTPTQDIHDTTPVDDVVAALDEITSYPYILLLDEADDVHKTDLSERLADIEYVSYIAICHNPEEWLPSLSSDARRRVRDHVEFRAYSVDQLADILEDRARLGLVEDAVERTTLERIGRHVDGKARNAIQALKAASDITVEDHRDHIKDVDVSAAVSRARAVVRSSNLRSLPSQHLLLYGLIQRAESILAEDLNREYDAVAEDVFDGDKEVPRSTETRRRYLRKLEAYDLIGSHGENRGTTYFAQDPELAVPEDADMEIPDVVEQ